MTHRLVDELDVAGKVVFCRVDFNVPLDGSTIGDDRRIQAALPTIEWLSSNGAKVLCASHLGRPKGERKPELSLAPVAARLGERLNREVPLAEDCIGNPVARVVEGLSAGDVALLENLRFHKGETKGDRDFAEQLAAPADLYVNDAFGAAHRAHASVSVVPEILGGGAAGYLMDKEIRALGHLVEQPERPYVAILGGAKVSDKIELIEKLIERVDAILIGGAMAYTFLAARGVSVGNSKIEEDRLDLARKLEQRAREQGIEIHLPEDHVIADGIEGRTPSNLAAQDEQAIPEGKIGLDIGPKTLDHFKDRLGPDVKTVLWNGPVGFFEASGCERGTRQLAEHIASMPAFSVLGGGDTAAAAHGFGLEDRFSHVSTGGGAALELLSGVDLPGIAALRVK
jgi:phosphoglycerate kinase